MIGWGLSQGWSGRAYPGEGLIRVVFGSMDLPRCVHVSRWVRRMLGGAGLRWVGLDGAGWGGRGVPRRGWVFEVEGGRGGAGRQVRGVPSVAGWVRRMVGWAGLDWAGLGWAGLGWAGLGGVGAWGGNWGAAWICLGSALA